MTSHLSLVPTQLSENHIADWVRSHPRPTHWRRIQEWEDAVRTDFVGGGANDLYGEVVDILMFASSDDQLEVDYLAKVLGLSVFGSIDERDYISWRVQRPGESTSLWLYPVNQPAWAGWTWEETHEPDTDTDSIEDPGW
jgi:hypothetical protein